MNHRTLRAITCAHCGKAFTIYVRPSEQYQYCSKSCSAKARTMRDGPPPAAGYGAHIKPSIAALAAFRREPTLAEANAQELASFDAEEARAINSGRC